MSNIYAPQLDDLIQRASGSASVPDKTTKSQVLALLETLEALEICGDDERKELWLWAKRGSIDDFGAYEEYLEAGEVESREEFQELWEYYYPEPMKWYQLITITYNKVHYVFFGDELVFEIHPEPQQDYSVDNSELAAWLISASEHAIQLLQAGSYNDYLVDNLPYKKRLGKILRSDYWRIEPEFKEAHLEGISPEEIQRFVQQIATQPERSPEARLPHMTSGLFFECCKLGYGANRYKNANTASARELYLANADGRDDGLLELDEQSADEFSRWYHDKSIFGGHPWEVCRGGNSTHISLYANCDEQGWWLSLAGSSWGRSVETVNFYMALIDQGYPVFLHDGAGLAEMLTGADYIGIVPEGVTPRYCGGLFPENGFLGFMNLPWENTEQVIAAAQWYPLPEVRLASSCLPKTDQTSQR